MKALGRFLVWASTQPWYVRVFVLLLPVVVVAILYTFWSISREPDNLYLYGTPQVEKHTKKKVARLKEQTTELNQRIKQRTKLLDRITEHHEVLEQEYTQILDTLQDKEHHELKERVEGRSVDDYSTPEPHK